MLFRKYFHGERRLSHDAVVNACHALANKVDFQFVSRPHHNPNTRYHSIYDLTRVLPDVILALGLHAPNQTLRRAIVPCGTISSR